MIDSLSALAAPTPTTERAADTAPSAATGDGSALAHPDAAAPHRDALAAGPDIDAVPTSPNDYRIAVDSDWIASDPEINTRLHAAGFTQAQAQLAYALAAERLTPMVAEVASLFDAERQVERLTRHFGGDARWRETARQIAAWGRRSLDAPIFDALATTYEGVLAMHAMMRNGEPPLVREGSGRADAVSEGHVRQLMRDPRYWRDQDPDIVRQVRDGFRSLYPD